VHLCVRPSTRHSTAAAAVLEFTTVRTIPLTKERRDYFNVVPNGDSDMLAPAAKNKMNTTVVSVFFSGEIWRCAITPSPSTHTHTHARVRAHHLHCGAGILVLLFTPSQMNLECRLNLSTLFNVFSLTNNHYGLFP